MFFSTPRFGLCCWSVLVALAGLVLEDIQQLIPLTLTDGLLLLYLGVFSSGVTFWLTQRATAILTPAAVTGYSYLVPFLSMLSLFIEQPQRIGWQWLPGSLMVLLSIVLLLKRDAANHRQNNRFLSHIRQQVRDVS
jgi:drug/metabolite transporter (DMT)-like permease